MRDSWFIINRSSQHEEQPLQKERRSKVITTTKEQHLSSFRCEATDGRRVSRPSGPKTTSKK